MDDDNQSDDTVTGNKDIALSIAAVFSIILLAKRPDITKESLSKTIQDAIADAGVIVLITCAGGAFGHVLRQTGIAGSIGAIPAGNRIWTNGGGLLNLCDRSYCSRIFLP